ncbi:MAG TPA: efflux RND transporter periplasmic adaptor subunit [Gemmatimonadales bacterium]
MRPALTVALLLLPLAACREEASPDDSGTELPGGAITLWTASTELFMEHPALFSGTPSRFAVHLTDLADFSAVRSGTVTLRFKRQDGGEPVEVVQEAPRSPGIYGLEVTFPSGGTWDLTLEVTGPQLTDRIEVPGLIVTEDGDEPAPTEEPAAGEISFLKEQQWKTPGFRTEAADSGALAATIEASGEIIPAADRLAIVAAPVDGIVDASSLQTAPLVGQRVAADAPLAALLPALGDAGSALAEAQGQLRAAEAEYDRARRLVAAEAAPQRRLLDAEVARDRARQALAGLGGGLEAGRLVLRSPIGGIIADRHIVAGARVSAGDPLFTIVDPSVIWVRARVPAASVPAIRPNAAARFRYETAGPWRPTGRRVTTAPLIDSVSRTLALVWEVGNPTGAIPIGTTATVAVPLGGEVPGVTIPASAIVEEDGIPVVYVQVAGESFTRRVVRLGARGADRAIVLDGVRLGERVVSGAAYQVRLASLGSSVPAHGHEH